MQTRDPQSVLDRFEVGRQEEPLALLAWRTERNADAVLPQISFCGSCVNCGSVSRNVSGDNGMDHRNSCAVEYASLPV